MADLGYFSLRLALFITLYALIIDFAGLRFRESSLIKSGKNAALASWICLSVAIGALLVALTQCDFRLEYVAKYTSSTLPLPYRLSALWAGAAGSLLLWLWMQVGITNLVFRKSPGSDFHAAARIPANIVAVFFLVVLLLDKNPFAVSALPPEEGAGLNPLLQHPAMVLHPPTLFLGYAAYLIPFAWALALIAWPPQESLPPLYTRVRNWMLIAWWFLTAGNILGSWWAYEELGWGGFWAWDPVENSSLMPWLIGTALLHSFKKFRSRSAMSLWVILLSLVTYSMCIFGTFLTRYGLVDSVHKFPDPGWGILFLWLIIVIWVIVAFLFIRRLRSGIRMISVKPARGQAVMVLTNCAFIVLTVVILLGTTFPFLSSLVTDDQITLQADYFTKITSVPGLGVLLLLGICPQIFPLGFEKKWRTISALIVAGIAAAAWLKWRVLSIPCFILCAFVALHILQDLISRVIPRKDSDSAAPPSRRPLSWYGARLAHIGVVLMFVGIAGSEGHGLKQKLALKLDQPVEIEKNSSKYSLCFNQLDTIDGPNFQLTAALISLSKNGVDLGVQKPGLSRYDSGDTTQEVDIHRTLLGDVYMALEAVGEGGRIINMTIQIKPLINWLWIGGIVTEIGTVLVLISWLKRRKSA